MVGSPFQVVWKRRISSNYVPFWFLQNASFRNLGKNTRRLMTLEIFASRALQLYRISSRNDFRSDMFLYQNLEKYLNRTKSVLLRLWKPQELCFRYLPTTNEFDILCELCYFSGLWEMTCSNDVVQSISYQQYSKPLRHVAKLVE